MRNVKMTAGLVALGMMLAASPATTRQADVVERIVVVRLPGEPVGHAGLGATPEPELVNAYNYLTSKVESNDAPPLFSAAADRLGEGAVLRGIALGVKTSSPEAFLTTGEIEIKVRTMPARDGKAGEAERLADAAAEVVRDRIKGAWDDQIRATKESLPKAKQEAAEAAGRLAKARERLAVGEAKLRERTGRIDLSAAGMQAAQDELELERLKVELDLVGLNARREGLQEAIKQQAETAREAQKTDVAVQAMTKAVEAAKARVQRVKQMAAAGNAPQAEVGEAELAELEAQARLAERTASAGGAAEAMAQWNRALTDAAIELREKEARLAEATKRLATLIDAATQQKELEAARKAEASAAKQLATTESHVQDLTDWLAKYGETPLTVEVKSGGRPATAPAAQ